MIGLCIYLLTPDEERELMDKLLSRAGATGARLGSDCTACEQPIYGSRSLGTIEMGFMGNGHRILYPLCAECVTERKTTPDAVGDRIEQQLARDFVNQALMDAEHAVTA